MSYSVAFLKNVFYLWMIILSSASLLLFCMPVTLATDRELSEVLTVVVDLSIFPSTSDRVFLIALEALFWHTKEFNSSPE